MRPGRGNPLCARKPVFLEPRLTRMGIVYSDFMRSPLAFLLWFLPISLLATPQASDDYSGMYSFLREGEFLQVTIEDQGKVTGFISRFGDSESDRGAFLDQFFKSGKLDGNQLSFTSENVHGTWFTFDGILGRGAGKKPEEEGYYLLRGKLTRFKTDAEKHVSQESRQVEFKSFPRDPSDQ